MAEAVWSGVAQVYARSFEGLCAGGIPAMLDGVSAGSRVLDVGCGTGSLTAAAGVLRLDVTGLDPDLEMVALARERGARETLVAGLPQLPLADGSFDVVLANFVLNHVDDPGLAVHELARVATPAGTVRATIWPGYPPPQARLWAEVLDRSGAVRPELPRLPEHLDFERTVEGFSALVGECSLSVVDARTVAWEWAVDPADLLAGMSAVGNFGVTWRAQTREVQERIAEAYAELVEPMLVSGLLQLPVECLFVEAVVADR